MKDYLVRATAAGSQIRAFAVTSTEMVETARQHHNTSPVATAALGRLLTAGAMMGSMMKNDTDILTIQIKCDGPIQGLTVTADSKANVKGYVENPDVMLPPKNGKLDVGGALGLGILNVIKDMGLKEPYVGQTILQTGEIGDDLTYYFANSEQVPSSVGLGVLMEKDNTVKCAGGFIVQVMPFVEEKVLEQLEEAKALCADPLVLIEQRLDFSRYVPDGFGTSDCLIVADKLLHIIDFKYGQGVLVDAEENPQMMLYALGALRQFDHLYDITQVAMSIYQPRRENVSTWTISVEPLMDWAEHTLKPKAEMAYQGEGDYVPGPWCTFCKAAVKCRARAEAKLQLAKYEFAMPPLLTDAEIEDILSRLPGLTKWAGEIEAYAQDAAIHHGKVWHGFKLVESRTNRKYTDEEAVIRAANAAGYHDIFKKTLIPITEMEKLMGKKAFAEILGSLAHDLTVALGGNTGSLVLGIHHVEVKGLSKLTGELGAGPTDQLTLLLRFTGVGIDVIDDLAQSKHAGTDLFSHD